MSSYRLIEKNKEPPGRWTYRLQLRGGGTRKIGPAHHFAGLVQQTRQVAAQSRTPVPTEEDIENQICRRSPGYVGCQEIERSTREPVDSPKVQPSENLPEQTIPGPDRYGRFLWQFLHMQGTRFSEEGFEATLAMVRYILADPEIGCVICKSHFAEFCVAYPPSKVTSARDAAVWTWHAHNHATRQKDKGVRRELHYNEAAVIYGWEPLTRDDVQTTLQKLTR